MDRTTRYQAAIIRDHHILLLRHQFTEAYACWEIPGGGRTEGESEIACVMREVWEEAGLDVHVEQMIYDGPSHPHTFYERFKIFQCRPIGEVYNGSRQTHEKNLDDRWFDLRDESQLGFGVINSEITCSVLNRIRQTLGYINPNQAAGRSSLIPTNLRCEKEYNPVNLDTPHPRFSWILQSEERGQAQSAYQILVTENSTLLWDSGKVLSRHQEVKYDGAQLTSRQGALWKVRIWDKYDKPSSFSEPSWFRMALLDPGDWHAEWIGYPAGWNGQALYFRHEFTLTKPVRSAWVYIAGLGNYELRLNGVKVGDHVLDPGLTDYGKKVFYTTYNLKPFTLDGPNVIGVILGNGWYGIPKLLLQAEYVFEDGTTLNVYTGHSTKTGNWMVSTGPILENSLYNGETYDARLENPGWDNSNTNNFPSWGWAVVTDAPGGKIIPQRLEPIRITETLSSQRSIQLKPELVVHDLGQNIAGWARLSVKGNPGDRITMRFAESLYPDGTVNQENLRRANATDTYILRGGEEEVWEPRFTYHGFRYVQVDSPTQPTIEGRVIRSDTTPSGTFDCSNELLNRIHKMVWWTEYTNQHSIPTDCPQRDERMGWLNDMAARSEEMLYNFNVSRFLPKWLDDIHNTQSTDGAITDTAPYRWGNRPADPVSVCYLLIPWLLYLHYGDSEILAKHYHGLKAWVDYLTSHTENNLLMYSYYGDWAPPRQESAGGTIGDSAISANTPGALVSTAFYYYHTQLLSKIAGVLKKPTDSTLYANLSKQIAQAYNQYFYNAATGGFGRNNQACNALSMYMGLVPDECQKKVMEILVSDVIAHGYHLTTGNLCTKYLLEVLSEYGFPDIAYRLATIDTYPSWGYMLANGATTLWERWEKITGGGMNSHNHPMLGSIDSWLYKYLGGITIDPSEPGFSKFHIRPYIADDLTYMRTSLMTVKGLTRVAWERKPDRLDLNVTIPLGSQSQIHIQNMKGNFSISESDTLLWENGLVKQNTGNIRFIKADPTHITFHVDSGPYQFQIKSKNYKE